MNSNIFFQPFVGKDYANGGYSASESGYWARAIIVMRVNHPSVGYSWDYWYKVIQRFLRNS